MKDAAQQVKINKVIQFDGVGQIINEFLPPPSALKIRKRLSQTCCRQPSEEKTRRIKDVKNSRRASSFLTVPLSSSEHVLSQTSHGSKCCWCSLGASEVPGACKYLYEFFRPCEFVLEYFLWIINESKPPGQNLGKSFWVNRKILVHTMKAQPKLTQSCSSHKELLVQILNHHNYFMRRVKKIFKEFFKI